MIKIGIIPWQFSTKSSFEYCWVGVPKCSVFSGNSSPSGEVDFCLPDFLTSFVVLQVFSTSVILISCFNSDQSYLSLLGIVQVYSWSAYTVVFAIPRYIWLLYLLSGNLKLIISKSFKSCGTTNENLWWHMMTHCMAFYLHFIEQNAFFTKTYFQKNLIKRLLFTTAKIFISVVILMPCLVSISGTSIFIFQTLLPLNFLSTTLETTAVPIFTPSEDKYIK